MTGEFNLELLNGNWSIAALALMVICAMYLMHEMAARRVFGWRWRSRLTTGMRVAAALLTLSFGIFMRSIETWRWRVSGGEIADLNQVVLQIGGIIAIIGFLCAIRELSLRLFGRAPWMWTLAAMVIFSGASVFFHFH